MQRIDQSIVLFFQSLRCEPLTDLFNVFIPLEFWNVVALVLVLWYFYRIRILRLPLISFVLARGLSDFCYGSFKHIVHRPRPFLTVKGLVLLLSVHGFSFPSGHATIAMAIAVVLGNHFPNARGLVYVLAVLVGTSRVYFGIHYLSDVLAGFVLGSVLGMLSIYLERWIIILTKGVGLRERTR